MKNLKRNIVAPPLRWSDSVQTRIAEPFGGNLKLVFRSMLFVLSLGFLAMGPFAFCDDSETLRVGGGLVDGKSQSIYPWDSWVKAYTSEPDLWHHDVFRRDGTPYAASELNTIRSLSRAEVTDSDRIRP